jgi:N-acetylmuramate 1-kinase
VSPPLRNAPPGPWLPVAVDASTRRYFKGQLEGEAALLADFGEDSDGLDRFVHVQRLFASHGLQVPEVIRSDPDDGWLVLSWIKGRTLSKIRWQEGLEDSLLGLAHSIGSVEEWGAGPPLLDLDGPRMAFELAFFRVHFLEGFLNLPSPEGLGQALEALAEQAASYPRTLAHRDLHSENVILNERGLLVLIDFQDALMAPRCYDAASLAMDAYRTQDPRIRTRFMEKWIGPRGYPRSEFEATALQRALKALGTFGYQVTRRKRARYLRFMAPQAAHALAFLASAPQSLESIRPHLVSLLAEG